MTSNKLIIKQTSLRSNYEIMIIKIFIIKIMEYKDVKGIWSFLSINYERIY